MVRMRTVVVALLIGAYAMWMRRVHRKESDVSPDAEETTDDFD
jgi:hypothetical protein